MPRKKKEGSPRNVDKNRDPLTGTPGAHPVGTGTVAEAVNPTAENEYWRENYRSRPYIRPGMAYDTIQLAYRYGWESRSRYDENKKWSDVESDLNSGWDDYRGESSMAWEDAREATRDAWNHLDDEVHMAHAGTHTDTHTGRNRR